MLAFLTMHMFLETFSVKDNLSEYQIYLQIYMYIIVISINISEKLNLLNTIEIILMMGVLITHVEDDLIVWIVLEKNDCPLYIWLSYCKQKLATYFYLFGKCQKCIKCILVIKCTNSTMQINLFVYKYGI